MFDKANEPATGSSGPKVIDLVNKLLIIRVLEHVSAANSTRTRTKKNEDGSETEISVDYIVADVVNLDAKTGEQEIMYDFNFFQGKLIAHFKTNVGKTLIGTMGKYPDTNIQGAYYFTDQSELPRINAVGQAWAQNNVEFFTTQAPGQPTRAKREIGGKGVFEVQHEAGPGTSTLDLVRNQGNTSEIPF